MNRHTNSSISHTPHILTKNHILSKQEVIKMLNRNRHQSHGCRRNNAQCCPSQMMPAHFGPGQFGPGQFSPQMMQGQFGPAQMSPQMMQGQFGGNPLSTQMMPTQIAPTQVSPETQFVCTNVMHTIVPHVHPAHVTTVNKHIIDHQHHFPVTESVVNECCENHTMCETPHHHHCGKQPK